MEKNYCATIDKENEKKALKWSEQKAETFWYDIRRIIIKI